MRIGKELLTYFKVSEIPTKFDNLITFEPDFPEPPHTLTDHLIMRQYPVIFREIQARERR